MDSLMNLNGIVRATTINNITYPGSTTKFIGKRCNRAPQLDFFLMRNCSSPKRCAEVNCFLLFFLSFAYRYSLLTVFHHWQDIDIFFF
uniref:Ovule protein n=1 Tax=Ascaris lumbricoides TaxID=6252 RepID=A0A0M3IJX0_ASCLU